MVSLSPFSPPLTLCHLFADVEIVDIPEELNITSLKGCGLQPNEVELPEGDAPPTNPEPVAVEIDEGVVMQLVSMGFDVEGCKRAVFNTKNQGAMDLLSPSPHSLSLSLSLTPSLTPSLTSSLSLSHSLTLSLSLSLSLTHSLTHFLSLSGIEPAMNWVLEHMGDPGQYSSVKLCIFQ